MSFIGDFAQAGATRQIAKYNSQVIQQQAALARRKAEINKQVYNTIDRPRLLKQQEAEYDYLFVRALATGAEVREGQSPYLALVESKINQATDLAITDYNAQTAYYDGLNQSLLLESQAIGEKFKGRVQANALIVKGLSTMGQNYYNSGGKSILASG